LVIFFR